MQGKEDDNRLFENLPEEQKEDFLFDTMPMEIQLQIASDLPSDVLAKRARVSKQYWSLFQPTLDARKQQLQERLQSVVRGEYEQVRTMLEEDPSLIFRKVRLTDYSGRLFKHISVFQYVLWALNERMWTLMIDCIPQDKEHMELFINLCTQYQEVKTRGVTYTLQGKTITEHHFDFQIIEELQAQTDLWSNPPLWDAGAMTDHRATLRDQWVSGVGRAQRLLPINVVDAYCSSPTFTEGSLRLDLQEQTSRRFFLHPNDLQVGEESWYGPDSQLGIEFAIEKKYRPVLRREPFESPEDTLVVMQTLRRVRTEEFTQLESTLEARVSSLANHHLTAQ